MSNNNSSISCTLGCWGLAIVAGILGAIILMVVGDWRLIQALFAAIVIAIILGALLSWIVCKPLHGSGELPARNTSTNPVPSTKEAAAAAATQAKAGATAEPGSAPAKAAAEARNMVSASAALPGQDELASRKGEWKYEGEAEEKPKPKAKAKPKAKPKAKAKPKKKEAPAAAAASEDYDGDGVLEGANEGTRPAALDGPRDGKADNLKEIKGIGPKMEKMCNALGFYHFDQIANWTADEVAWVNANLEGFKGRVTRDEWVAQAKILAAGGETEFSKRVEDGDVY